MTNKVQTIIHFIYNPQSLPTAVMYIDKLLTQASTQAMWLTRWGYAIDLVRLCNWLGELYNWPYEVMRLTL